MCGLKKDSRVLDIGCGCGRVASSLTSYFDEGTYDGFDVARPLVDWCARNITPRFPNFRFKWVDVFNGGWNPRGIRKGSEFQFPYPSNRFDVGWATAVFTHLLAEDTDCFLAEIARVLKPGGVCLLTLFLLNERSRAQMNNGKGIMRFPSAVDGCWLRDSAEPEQAVAYEERTIFAAIKRHGLDLARPVHYGSWPRARTYFFSQDTVVVEKRLAR
jgi:SAM-dependent methyltransferase